MLRTLFEVTISALFGALILFWLVTDTHEVDRAIVRAKAEVAAWAGGH